MKFLFIFLFLLAPLAAHAQAVPPPSIPKSALGQPGGVAQLDGNGYLPFYQRSGGEASSAILLPHWRAAIAKMRNGASVIHPRVIIGSDSTIAGGSGVGGTNIINITYYLAACLQQNGIQANNNGVLGTGPLYSGTGVSFSRLTTDARFTAGSWIQYSSLPTLGGETAGASAAGAPLVYAPNAGSPNHNPINTFEIYYPSWNFVGLGMFGSFTATATGGTAVAINGTTGTDQLYTAVATASSTSATNMVSLNWTANGAGNNAAEVGIDAYNSAVSSVQIFNTGVSGAVLAQWMTNIGFITDPLVTLEYLAPVLTIIEFGPNDLSAGNSAASVKTELQTAITAAQLSGDVMLMTWTPDLRSPSLTPSYLAMAKALAAADNIPLYDLNARWVSEPISSALGYYVTSDSDHPNSIGYADQAQGLCHMLLN
jgi:lysophospholipase L1-like esterase